jgi:WD40 repeat protein
MADSGAGEKLKVFISYSRRDSAAFADELVAGLEVAGFAPFLDRHDIAPGEDWEARLGGLIAQSDTVVFVVSPEAVKSVRCVWEVDRTLEQSKRLLPVVFKPVPEGDIPEKLRRLQFVRFDSGSGFTRPLSQLAESLRVDLDWIREHTRLGELATRWDRRRRPETLLLRGDEIDAAKAWMVARKTGAPEFTDAQRAFISASEEAESVRLGKERAQLKATARLQRRIAWLLGGVGAIIAAAVMAVGYLQWDKARQLTKQEIARTHAQANILAQLSETKLLQGEIDSALRLASRGARIDLALPPDEVRISAAAAALAAVVFQAKWRFGLGGHDGPVFSAAFSPGGSRIVTASGDRTARIWDAASAKEIAVLRGHDGAVRSAAFSPDGLRIVTASDDKTARIWDAASAKEIAVLRGHSRQVNSAAFSPDGSRIVTASGDGARIWDAASAKEIAVLRVSQTAFTSAAFSPDGSRIVTASGDTAAIWDAARATEIAFVRDGHVSYVNSLIADLRGHRQVNSAAFSPDGSRIVTTDDNTAGIWDAASAKEIAVLRGHDGPVFSAAFSLDGSHIVTASMDGTARIWDAASAKEVAVLRGHDGAVRSAAFSPDGSRIVTASDDKTARSWEAAIKEIAVLRGHGAAFSPDGSRIVTASDHTARIWDAASAKEIAVLRGHDDRVTSAAFSPDESRIITASDDCTARIWDAATAQEIAVLRHDGPVLSAAFSPDGLRIVTASRDNTARVWDAASPKEIAVLRGHEDGVTSAAFSLDGSRIVTASMDRTARSWDAASAKEVAVLRGHGDTVWSAAFSADGLRIVTASDDNTARIWDAASHKEIAVLGHDGHVFSAAFSPDGARIVTTSVDETAHIWDAHLETMSVKNLLTEACERLTSLTKMTRDEMRLVGYPDSMPEIDVCQ